MKRIFYLLCIIIPAYICGCKEEGRIDHIDDSIPAPPPVSIVKVTGKPGGAVIKYSIPDDDNLLGVKVVYTRNGEICESKASRYVDTLVVEGFGNTDPQEVKLFSVGVNEKLSEPVSTTISPLLPPVQAVKFDVASTFGGVIISLEENNSHADLAIVLMTDTATGYEEGAPPEAQWIDLQTFHTKSLAMKFARRGLDARPALFGAYLRDRWNNISDTIYKTLTPIEEYPLPEDRFRNAALPTDFYSPAEGHTGYRIENLWGGDKSESHSFYASSHSGPMPQWFTIELGRKMSISRIRKWPRSGADELYSSTAPRIFQVWGSNDPNPDGSWDSSWKLLGEFEQFKPSGYGEGREVGPVTDEDKDYWYNKTEFELIPSEEAPDPYQPVSYLRFKILSTFNTYGTDATMSQIIIGELQFFGQYEKGNEE